jgi:hypothetical protein
MGRSTVMENLKDQKLMRDSVSNQISALVERRQAASREGNDQLAARIQSDILRLERMESRLDKSIKQHQKRG